MSKYSKEFLDKVYRPELTGFDLGLAASAIDVLFAAIKITNGDLEKIICAFIPPEGEHAEDIHKYWHLVYGAMSNLVSTRDGESLNTVPEKLESLLLQDVLEAEIRAKGSRDAE